MADSDIFTQEFSYPDNKYEGGLGVEDKVPAVKWRYPNKKAVCELGNWCDRKSYEDINALVEWLSKYGGTQPLSPHNGLTPVSGSEPDTVYVSDYFIAFEMPDNAKTEVRADGIIVRKDTSIVLHWSMPDLTGATDPELDINMDLVDVGESPGTETISSSLTLSVPSSTDQRQENEISLGDISEGDSTGDGWDDVLGSHLSIFIARDPSGATGALHLHDIEVR